MGTARQRIIRHTRKVSRRKTNGRKSTRRKRR